MSAGHGQALAMWDTVALEGPLFLLLYNHLSEERSEPIFLRPFPLLVRPTIYIYIFIFIFMFYIFIFIYIEYIYSIYIYIFLTLKLAA